MAAPNLVGTPIQQSFSNVNPWTVTIPSGFTAGNTIVVLIPEIGSANRDVTSCSDGVNSYIYAIAVNSTNTPAVHAQILKCEAIAAVPPSSTLTINFTGGCTGQLTVLELEPSSEDTSQRDGDTDVATTTTPRCGVGNLTTPDNSIVVCVGATNGSGTLTAGTGYTKIGAGVSQNHAQYRRDATGAATNNGSFHSSIARSYAGVLAVFVAAVVATKSLPPHQRGPRFFNQRF